MAPLLPKLRGHFAEFLNKGSPVRLRIFSSPTCVGFRYGHHMTELSSFSCQREIARFVTEFHSPSGSDLCVPYFTNTHPRPWNPVDHHRARVILLCHCFVSHGGAGILTCCPSATTSVLTLGPDLPWADEPSPGNLGLSTAMFLAWLSLLIPALSLLYCPHVLSVVLQPVHNAPLPIT